MFSFPENNYVHISEEIRKKLGLTEEGAIGCIWYKNNASNDYSIKPVVWVRGTNSTYFETACGSGTVALGLFLAKENKADINISIGQPSGESIWVSVDFDETKGCFNEAWIGGKVNIIAHGETYLY
jgi:diaminopimelate epimerase